MKWLFPLLLATAAGACSQTPGDDTMPEPGETSTPVPPPASAAPVLRDAWVGRWIGVEGLNLTVAKAAEPGRYRLQMQYGTDTDMAGTFDGVGTADGIAFTRPDGAKVLRAATGDETGLKYLAGKSDCLKVQDGEGYCRQ